jgi:hypothetical protein
MKGFSKSLPAVLMIFALGLAAVFGSFFAGRKLPDPAIAAAVIAEKTPLGEAPHEIVEQPVESTENEDDQEYIPALDKIWIEKENFSTGAYRITKKCIDKNSISITDNCEIKIFKAQKPLASFKADSVNWLQFGFFKLLDERDRQLIVYSYSGGAHCCIDYVIYDLKPDFRVIYDSRQFDSGAQIGNYLTPVDIDGDGVLEFHQSVMAFDYFFASHADSVFPPAVFSYRPQTGRYELANRDFPGFVMDELEKNLAWLKKYRQTAGQPEFQKQTTERYILRKNFINLVYAGKEAEAWTYFDENYRFEDREEFRAAVRKRFSEDVVYKSIYDSRSK